MGALFKLAELGSLNSSIERYAVDLNKVFCSSNLYWLGKVYFVDSKRLKYRPIEGSVLAF